MQMDAKSFKMTGTLTHGTHLRVLSEGYPMNTNMTGIKSVSKGNLRLCALNESSLMIGRVNIYIYIYICFLTVIFL